jgi:hypothetical protein
MAILYPSTSTYPSSSLYPEIQDASSSVVFYHRPIVQSIPTAATNTDVYTAPSGRQVIFSGITVCNQATTSATYRIAIRDGGAALAAKHYIHYDEKIAGNKTDICPMGVTIQPTDIVTVYSSTSNLSFCFFGVLCYV